jgi:hypothetical protein
MGQHSCYREGEVSVRVKKVSCIIREANQSDGIGIFTHHQGKNGNKNWV